MRGCRVHAIEDEKKCRLEPGSVAASAHASHVLNIGAHWRIVSRSDHSPFAVQGQDRPLRIVVDEDTIEPKPEVRFLQSLAARPGVEIYGTKASNERRVVIGKRSEHDVVPVEYVLPKGGRGMRLFQASWLDRAAEMTANEHDVSPNEAYRSLALAAACERHEIDALVTASPTLSLPTWKNLTRKASTCEPKHAIALLGLYLRAHRDFTVRVEGTSSTFLSEDRFYRGAASAALPGFERWLAGAVSVWRNRAEPASFSLLRGLEMRLARALRARDYFQVRIRSHRPDDTWDEALFFFEYVLLLLSGALDAAARCCHLLFGVSGKRNRASWRRPEWCAELLRAQPRLAGLIGAEGGRLAATAILVGVLRNYIHGEAPSQEFHQGDHGGPLTIDYGPGALAIAPDDGQRLISAADSIATAADWGLTEQHDGVVLVLPAQYLVPVVRATFRSLAELLATLGPSIEDSPEEVAQFDPSYWIAGHDYQRELLLLSGLSSVSGESST
jgi:hypothetical protein